MQHGPRPAHDRVIEADVTCPLVALQLPPERLHAALSAQWESGTAVLPLAWPPSASAAARSAQDRLLAATRPARLIRDDGGVDRIVERDDGAGLPDGTALIVATSGSTGAPKAVVIGHEALRTAVDAGWRRLGASFGETFVLALPAHHVGGLLVLLRASRSGTAARVVAPGDTDALDHTEGDHIALVPTQLRRLLAAAPERLAGWRSVLVGGGPAEPELLEAARDAGAPLVCAYGMTETTGGCVYDGVPLDGVEVATDTDGRIRIRGPVLFSGYLDDLREGRSSLDDAGWFVTSDLGRFAADGRLEVLGRVDDMIVTGGNNVPAQALTEVLQRHPSIRDAAVIGWPDPEWGQIVVAVVVAASDATVELPRLREHVRAALPAWYAPRRLVVTDTIPRTPLGKPDHDRLGELAAQTLSP